MPQLVLLNLQKFPRKFFNFNFVKQHLFISKSIGFLLIICIFYVLQRSLWHSPTILCLYPSQSQIFWAISSAPSSSSCSGPSLVAMGALVGSAPLSKALLHKRKALLLKTFSNVHWNIYQSIQSYIKQPVSLTQHRVENPRSGQWNEQRNAAILVGSSTILAQHGLCLTSETVRLLKCFEMSKIN